MDKMNDLPKRFEEEIGLPLTLSLETEDSIFFYDNPAYVIWLQEQLTWRSVEEELPEDNEEIWVETSRYKGAGRREGVCWYTCYGEEINTPRDWLPIPN